MPWIRWDCSILDDEFMVETLTSAEFKAWSFFLLRVKAMGARGRVKKTSLSSLARNWNIEPEVIESMLDKAKQSNPPKIKEANNVWYITNWARYQDEHKAAKGEIPEDAEKAPNGSTLHYTTLQDTTQQKEKDKFTRMSASNRKELKEKEFILRCDDKEFRGFCGMVQQLITAENQYRTNKFIWVPTMGDFHKDMRRLVYGMGDEEKKKILMAAFNSLNGKCNWIDYLLLTLKYTIRTSEKTRVDPFKFTAYIIKRPSEIAAAISDGILSH